jgi:hypothetical protein
MTRFLRSHKWITALCIFGAFWVLCWLWSLAAPMRRRLAAQVDMQRGRYQVLGYGMPSPSRPECPLLARTIQDRLSSCGGLHSFRIAGFVC